jgi:hypothetical protein
LSSATPTTTNAVRGLGLDDHGLHDVEYDGLDRERCDPVGLHFF